VQGDFVTRILSRVLAFDVGNEACSSKYENGLVFVQKFFFKFEIDGHRSTTDFSYKMFEIPANKKLHLPITLPAAQWQLAQLDASKP